MHNNRGDTEFSKRRNEQRNLRLFEMKKRIHLLIATVLLIAFTLAVATIVMTWLTSFITPEENWTCVEWKNEMIITFWNESCRDVFDCNFYSIQKQICVKEGLNCKEQKRCLDLPVGVSCYSEEDCYQKCVEYNTLTIRTVCDSYREVS